LHRVAAESDRLKFLLTGKDNGSSSLAARVIAAG